MVYLILYCLTHMETLFQKSKILHNIKKMQCNGQMTCLECILCLHPVCIGVGSSRLTATALRYKMGKIIKDR